MDDAKVRDMVIAHDHTIDTLSDKVDASTKVALANSVKLDKLFELIQETALLRQDVANMHNNTIEGFNRRDEKIKEIKESLRVTDKKTGSTVSSNVAMSVIGILTTVWAVLYTVQASEITALKNSIKANTAEVARVDKATSSALELHKGDSKTQDLVNKNVTNMFRELGIEMQEMREMREYLNRNFGRFNELSPHGGN